jgi:hypothetical protein
MEGVLVVVAMLALVVGVISKKYLFKSTPRSRLGASSGDYPDTGDIQTEVRDKWKRPLETLPVHVDIPRLARKISVFTVEPDNTKKIVLSPQDDLPSESNTESQVIKELLKTLSKYLGESETQQTNIDTKFMEYFKRTADPSLALADFLSDVVGHESPTACVLKACNQSVLAPGVLVLIFVFSLFSPVSLFLQVKTPFPDALVILMNFLVNFYIRN